jgi:Leucine-rich repeat (LRR) protein
VNVFILETATKGTMWDMETRFKICQRRANRFLLLEGPWDPDIAPYFEAYGVTHLRLSAYAGWREKQIDFLRSLPFLTKLDLAAVGLKDVSPLYELPNLKALSVNGLERRIDFPRIPSLRNLNIHWSQKNFSSLLDCTELEELGLDGYSGPDLKPFRNLKKMHNFALSFSRVETLVGIENCVSLGRFPLALVNRLTSLDHLEGCGELWHVSVEGAKALQRIDAVAQLPYLREFSLVGCPRVESIKPLARLPVLESVFFRTTVIQDGDMSPLLTLPSLKHATFNDRKHYSHNNAEFPKPKTYKFGELAKVLFDSKNG